MQNQASQRTFGPYYFFIALGHNKKSFILFQVWAILFAAVSEAKNQAGWYYCDGQKYPAKIVKTDYGKTKIRYLTKREADSNFAVCTPYPRNIKTEDFDYGPTKTNYHFGKGKDTENEFKPNYELKI